MPILSQQLAMMERLNNMSSSSNNFTPTQKRILDVLADGLPHRRDELLDCLDDPLCSTRENLQAHLTRLRVKLRPAGHDIICQLLNNCLHYRHIVMLSTDE